MTDKRSRVEQAREFRRAPTPTEALLWDAIRNRKLGGLKFRRQHLISPFILDFYCPEAKLAIEVDGQVHDHQKDYDQNRTAFLEEREIAVVRFTNYQIETHLEHALSEILKAAESRLGK